MLQIIIEVYFHLNDNSIDTLTDWNETDERLSKIGKLFSNKASSKSMERGLHHKLLKGGSTPTSSSISTSNSSRLSDT